MAQKISKNLARARALFEHAYQDYAVIVAKETERSTEAVSPQEGASKEGIDGGEIDFLDEVCGLTGAETAAALVKLLQK